MNKAREKKVVSMKTHPRTARAILTEACVYGTYKYEQKVDRCGVVHKTERARARRVLAALDDLKRLGMLGADLAITSKGREYTVATWGVRCVVHGTEWTITEAQQ